ncbi:MAG: alpha/beta hydrolase [Patescibacteria group bacterium]
MTKQIVVIHGGDTFETYDKYLEFLNDFEINLEWYKTSKNDWKPWLRERLGSEYEVILPQMPNKTNAQYEEWSLWFEKLIPFLNDEVILIGHSLGAVFLAKYLSLNKFPKTIKGVFLVGAVYNKDTDGYTLASFSIPDSLDLQSDNVFLYHSEDDPVVPFSDLALYEKALPHAIARVFKDRQHLTQSEFPELAEDILKITI